jgi:carnitine-CoA ligase
VRPMPPPEQFDFRRVLERFAALKPAATCVIDPSGDSWTWGEAADQMRGAAQAMSDLGLPRGDRLGVMLPNGFDWLRAWWGAAGLGITVVAINPALRGEMLRHVCTETEVHRVVTTPDLWPRVAELGMPVALVDPETIRPSGKAADVDWPEVHPWDPAMINFTSGTTGPSKGVATTHMHLHAAAATDGWGLTDRDTVFAHMPLFHTGGMAPAMACWQAGGIVALRSQFRASTFLDEVRSVGATFVVLVGTMASVLHAMPMTPDEDDNPLRMVNMIPLIPDIAGFMKRFGIPEVQVMYGMTEVPQALHYSWKGSVERPTAAGILRPGFEAQIVDEDDIPVADGTVGELTLRNDRPWTITTEYVNRPADTARAWRNGWFHTGDLFIREDEFFYFQDRGTDSLRRRGENISSYEVERAVLAYPDVSEAACVGVRTEHGDQDVKIFVARAGGKAVDYVDLLNSLRQELPYFAVPRFVEVMDELPKTPTGRIRKDVLRERGNSSATWDRESAGVKVSRDY